MARRDLLNLTHFWRDRRLDGLSLMRADLQTHQYAPHRHEGFVVAVTEFGGSVIRSRGRVEEAHASALLVFNPDEPHAGTMGTSRRWRYRSLYVEGAAIAALEAMLGVPALPRFTRNVFHDPDLIAAFLTLHRVLQEGGDALAEREALVTSFGGLFSRHGSERARVGRAPRDRARLATAVELMRSSLGDALSLADLAEALGLSHYQTIALFKRMTGLPPYAYFTQLRLDAARRRLGAGEAIAEVALACGFYDQSALTSAFKRCYGMTPLQFAAATGR